MLINRIYKIATLNALIAKENTGDLADLSQKLCLTTRQVKRTIKMLKQEGIPIRYSVAKKTYYYTEEVKFTMSIVVAGKELIQAALE